MPEEFRAADRAPRISGHGGKGIAVHVSPRTVTGRVTKANRRLLVRYLVHMLSAAAVAATLGTAGIYAAGHEAFLADLLVRVAVLLGGVNLVGAALLFAPVWRYLGGDPARRDAAASRLRALPILSGAWLSALAAVVIVGHVGQVQGSWAVLRSEDFSADIAVFAHVAVFAGYLGLYGYFLAADCVIALRRELWKRGQAIPRRAGKLVRGLTAAFAAVALGPVFIIAADQWTSASGDVMQAGAMYAHHETMMRQTLQMDVFGALILAGVVIWLVSRRLSQPVQSLVTAMRRVDRGDKEAEAAVVSDDEFGVLAEHFNGMLEGLRERDRIRRTFARFVPESVASALLAQEGLVAPQEREATVLYADIEDFTRTASRLAPHEILQMLNDYFEEVGRIIAAHSGVITQFQGDAVLATFNLPLADPNHARDALEAAQELDRRLGEVTFATGLRLRVRIGVCSGLLVGGTVGGGERLGYTVHGDTVNLAARLEALNKELRTRILVSARTAELVGATMPLRDRGAVAVRGFEATLRVFELVSTVTEKLPRAAGHERPLPS